MGFFPVDDQTLRLPAPRPAAPRPKSSWSSATRRSSGCSAPTTAPTPKFTKVLSLDLGTVEPSLAGPKRPQDRVPLEPMQAVVPQGAARAGRRARLRPRRGGPAAHGHGRRQRPRSRRSATARWSSPRSPVAPTPAIRRVMLAAGLLAKKAVEQGPARAAVREDQPRARLARGDRLPREGRARQAARRSSASTPSATAARPASATAARCPSRSPRPSPRATWWPRPCSAATATSKAASIRW